MVYAAVSFISAIALAAILGAADYGGLRAAQIVLGPLTLLGTAVALPGLPLVSRLVATSPPRALAAAARFGALVTTLTCIYVFLLYSLPDVLSFAFGPEFSDFGSLILPIGLGQVLAAPAMGLVLFLKAAQRGRALLLLGTVQVVSYLCFSVMLSLSFGLTGAAGASASSSAPK